MAAGTAHAVENRASDSNRRLWLTSGLLFQIDPAPYQAKVIA